mmetsp:Transcript_18261/g.33087  ORF Transcript_18261/g.33087 Transcript_18261/m.33087 type:complete len:206 (-) Transcript_18261:311-928(-)
MKLTSWSTISLRLSTFLAPKLWTISSSPACVSTAIFATSPSVSLMHIRVAFRIVGSRSSQGSGTSPVPCRITVVNVRTNWCNQICALSLTVLSSSKHSFATIPLVAPITLSACWSGAFSVWRNKADKHESALCRTSREGSASILKSPDSTSLGNATSCSACLLLSECMSHTSSLIHDSTRCRMCGFIAPTLCSNSFRNSGISNMA